MQYFDVLLVLLTILSADGCLVAVLISIMY